MSANVSVALGPLANALKNCEWPAATRSKMGVPIGSVTIEFSVDATMVKLPAKGVERDVRRWSQMWREMVVG